MSNVSMVGGYPDDPKRTDDDIIKALEYCKRTIGTSECTKCPYFETEGSCTKQLFTDTLDLIKRKDEEIEKFQNELKITRQYIHENNLEYDLLAYSKRGSE